MDTVTRTIHEKAGKMIRQRSGHKLTEWREFVGFLKDLPGMKEIAKDDED